MVFILWPVGQCLNLYGDGIEFTSNTVILGLLLRVVGQPIRALEISQGVRFGAIVRQGKLIRPTGDTELQPRDRVIVFSPAKNIREIEQLFRVSPDYF